MNKKTILDTITHKLKHSYQLFLDKTLIENILSTLNSSYNIYNLVQEGLIEVIKKDAIYLNKVIDKHPRPEALIGLYHTGSQYMIGGTRVYNHYRFTTQQAQSVTVYSDRVLGPKTIAGQNFHFFKKTKLFFYGRKRRQTQGVDYYIMDRERALIAFVLENKGVLEFKDQIIAQLQDGTISRSTLGDYATKHLSQSERHVLSTALNIGISSH